MEVAYKASQNARQLKVQAEKTRRGQEGTVKDGRIEQENFDTYQMMRMDEMPVVESTIMPSGGFVVTTVTLAPASRKAQAHERRIPAAAETSGAKIRLTTTTRLPTCASRRSMETGHWRPVLLSL